MKKKHTQGKWKQRKSFDNPILISSDGREWYYNAIYIQANDNRVICEVKYQTDTDTQGWGNINKVEAFEANAKLIAAAPDLLEALSELVNMFDPDKQTIYEFARKGIEDAKKAIKKATE